jgi:hypothetical protein
MYKYIVKHKEFIGALGAVFGSLGVIIAIIFSTISLMPKPK